MDEKLCSTCRQTRPVSDFNRSSRLKDGLQPRCRLCDREWYVRNREVHKANTARRSRAVREEYHRRLIAHLDQHACADCGEHDVVVLEFDHRDPATKVREIARLVSDLVAWSTVEAEIAKCDIVCANCHRKRTAERGDQRRHRHQRARESAEAAAARDRLAGVLPPP